MRVVACRVQHVRLLPKLWQCLMAIRRLQSSRDHSAALNNSVAAEFSCYGQIPCDLHAADSKRADDRKQTGFLIWHLEGQACCVGHRRRRGCTPVPLLLFYSTPCA